MDEADMAQDTCEALVNSGLARVMARARDAAAAPHWCEDCGATAHQLRNGMHARFCLSCIGERGIIL